MNRISLLLALGVSAAAFSVTAQEQSTLDSRPATPTTSENSRDADDVLRSLGLTIGSGVKIAKDKKQDPQLHGGYYVVFGKADADWRITRIETAKTPVSDFSHVEVLFFNKSLTYVEPDYRDGLVNPKTQRFSCWTGVLRSRKDNGASDYNPCESSLTSTVDARIGHQAMLAVFSLGTSLLTGTTFRDVAVDNTKVLALIQESNVLPQLRERVEADNLAIYRNAFSRARTSGELDALIRRYANNDPDGLIPPAMERRDRLAIKEAEAQEKRRQSEIDQSRRNTLAVQTKGARICKSVEATFNADTGARIYSAYGYKPVTRPIPGTVTVTGFTEGISWDRLQIRAGSIRHTSPSGKRVDLETFEDGDVGASIRPGTVFWDSLSKWNPC